MTENRERDAGESGAGAPPDVTESNHAPDLTRQYNGDGIEVLWYARRCVHAAECIAALPTVFDPRRRPWIDASRADTDAIARAVEACPTGALEYIRPGAPERAPEVVSVQPLAGGPNLLRGNITVRDEAGNILRQATRVALCRCGKSENQPFCDNSHRAIRKR